jgi:O-antigen/teichoic acid export membrane protein
MPDCVCKCDKGIDMSIWEKLRAQMPVRGNLSGRAAGATMWSIGELGANYVLRLGSNLIMTRLLLPEAFGLMAMVTTLHIALTLLSDLGIGQSIVRSERGEETRYLRVAWTIQIMRTAGIAVMVLVAAFALWMLAPSLAPAGTVYADPALPALIAVSSVVVLLAGLESTNMYVAGRRMQLKWVTVQNISAQAVALIAMVVISQFSASVWSLLWGMITGSVFRMALSHIVFPGPRMGLAWDREIADEFWHFGKWVIGSSLMTFVAGNADRIFLAAVFDKEHFGFYVIAVIWAQAGVQLIHRIVTQIGLPLFSGVNRDRPHDLPRVYQRFSRLVGILCAIGFLGLFFGGALLILFLYPESYAQSASFMPFLALATLREWFSPLFTLMISLGKSKAAAISSFCEALTTCLALPLGVHFGGVEGGLLAVALSPLGGVPTLIPEAHRAIGLDMTRNIIIFVAILVAGAAVGFFLNPLL